MACAFLCFLGWDFAGSAGCGENAILAEGPGMERERQAEKLERRDQPLAAQLEYLEALKEVMAAAAAAPEAQYLWARAEFLLERIAALAAITAEREEILPYLQSLQGPPLFMAQAAWLAGRLHLQAGDAAAAARAVQPLNLMREWLVIGPFDNEQGRSFATPFPPEENCDPNLVCQGKAGPVRWRHHLSREPLGYVNLETIMRPNSECLAYALCFVQAPRRLTACLRIGSDDSFAAWVNGQPLMPRLDVVRQARPDQNVYPLQLEEGWNALLFKIGQVDDEWGFYARLTDARGQPLAGLLIEASAERLASFRPPKPQPANETLTEIDKGAISYLSDLLTRHPDHPRACYYLGTLIQERQLGESREREERALFRRAAERAPQERTYWLALARSLTAEGRLIFDRDENLRRLILERVRSADPAEPHAALELAAYYLKSLDNLERGQSLLEQALAANPLSAWGQTLLFDLYRRRGWQAPADALIAEAAKRHPRCLEIRLRQALALMEQGQTRAALEAWRAAVQADATDLRARQGEYAALRSLEPAAAAAALRHFLALRPGQAWARLRL
ncbi:MAG: hypothetical protein N3A66_06405, partial [Planctomycetota bacterium]|nr:hypothetical protein [Planctomycetota bacterium]